MNVEKFLSVYNERRNGANQFYKHPLVRNFHYSDGVRDLALTGCYWMLDVAATEIPAAMRKHEEIHGILEVTVSLAQTCRMELTVDDDKPAIWKKLVGPTTLPVGTWLFELADEGERVAMILLSEH